MKKLIIALTLLALTLVPVQTMTQGTSPASLVASDPNLSLLLAAAEAAGLTGALAGDVTVFAPTNGAFGTLLGELGVTQDQLLADRATLTAVLTYHVVPGTFSAGDVLNAGSVDLPTANGASLNAQFVNNRVSLNGGRAIVVGPNRFADVGVVHVINNVLLPPEAVPAPTPLPQFPVDQIVTPPTTSILSIATSNPDLSLFVSAVEAAGLTSTLNGAGPFTVFVPTNSAFNTLATNLALDSGESLLDDVALLQGVLTYHVVPERWLAAELIDLGGNALGPTINGSLLPIGVVSRQTIPTVNGTSLPVGEEH
ncbi:MAG: fasciclin domain-containing protein [Chloroflexota bacterium]